MNNTNINELKNKTKNGNINKKQYYSDAEKWARIDSLLKNIENSMKNRDVDKLQYIRRVLLPLNQMNITVSAMNHIYLYRIIN